VSTHLVALLAVLGLALLVLGLGWSALVVSSREEADQARWIETMAAGLDVPDGLDGSDYSEKAVSYAD